MAKESNITWGEPVQIFATRMDEECGVCGAKVSEGLDLSEDKKSCLCFRCGFAFGFDLEDEPPKQSRRRVKRYRREENIAEYNRHQNI